MSMRLPVFLTALCLAGAAVSSVAAEQTILPGYWASRNTSKLLTTKTTEDRRCITAAQVNNFLTTPNHYYRCNYATHDVGGGHIRLQGQCVDKKGVTVDVTATGAYGPEWFKLDAKVSLDGLPIGATASTEAHRLSETCPPAPPAQH